MTLAQLRSRIRLKHDLNEEVSSSELVDAIINEGLREMARETLLLEEKNSSLTFADPGFTLPTDFIKVRELLWVTSSTVYSKIEAASIDLVYHKRNNYAYLSTSDDTLLVPSYYAIDQGEIILDSTTETSPTLYYYEYDTALSADSSEPSFDSEYHKHLIDYALWQLTGQDKYRQLWELGLKKMTQTKSKSRSKRIRHKAY